MTSTILLEDDKKLHGANLDATMNNHHDECPPPQEGWCSRRVVSRPRYDFFILSFILLTIIYLQVSYVYANANTQRPFTP